MKHHDKLALAATIATAAAAVGALAFAQSADATGGGHHDKVTICHVPPGNPENAHTIEVSESAVPAHLAHGDSLGSCPTEPTEEPTEQPTEEPSEEPSEEPTEEPSVEPTVEPEPETPTAPEQPEQGIGTAIQAPTSTVPVCVGGSLQWTTTDGQGNTAHHSDASAPECDRQPGEAPQNEEG